MVSALHAEAMHSLRLMCTPGALPDDATVTITAFADAFCAASAPEGTSGPPSAAAAPLGDSNPLRCAVTAATAQHCLALAGLALRLLTRCLGLRPAPCAELVPPEVLRETCELMEYGDPELQVRPRNPQECLRLALVAGEPPNC